MDLILHQLKKEKKIITEVKEGIHLIKFTTNKGKEEITEVDLSVIKLKLAIHQASLQFDAMESLSKKLAFFFSFFFFSFFLFSFCLFEVVLIL
jgi:hypothetical protein